MRPDKARAAAAWAVLAREYEALLRALCESANPIALLADWAAHAGLPAPKASPLSDVRWRNLLAVADNVTINRDNPKRMAQKLDELKTAVAFARGQRDSV